ncbi:hypothetical protein BDZ90DRAFT_263040 [Jaminaea rosea]|uniref:Uncharacterized protein n=1 Tax=Jaminaea rosea TaxID=1569628 RepID=A0A316UHL3_9BASI|nr:hypothetical protein BDZ90DRAFT_263040 [Jaminaea rosea]PWN24827.1 hypothetical protein BDZ90DRAFT_263040 [Jaminaea rosea]
MASTHDLEPLALPSRTLRPSASLQKLSTSWRRNKATTTNSNSTPTASHSLSSSCNPPFLSNHAHTAASSSSPAYTHQHSSTSTTANLAPPRPAFFYDGQSASTASSSTTTGTPSSSSASASPNASSLSLDSLKPAGVPSMPSMRRLLGGRRASGEANDRRSSSEQQPRTPPGPERSRSPPTNAAPSNGTSFRSIGRRLFFSNTNSSKPDLDPSSYPTDRSHSYSSESTANSSPPRTPPSPQHGFTYTGGLPQLPPLASFSVTSSTTADGLNISPKSKIPATPIVIPPRRSSPPKAQMMDPWARREPSTSAPLSSTVPAPSRTSSLFTITPTPAKPAVTSSSSNSGFAASSSLSSSLPSATAGTSDFLGDSSDFLEAVLSLSTDDGETSQSLFRNDEQQASTSRSGPAPMSTLSSSFTSPSFPSARSTTSLSSGSRRMMTEAQAAQINEEQRKRRPKLTIRPGFANRNKPSLWAQDSESDDEYGGDEDSNESGGSSSSNSKRARPTSQSLLATSPTTPADRNSLFPSSFSFGRRRSPSPSPSPSPTFATFKDVAAATPPPATRTPSSTLPGLSPPGLSTPAKRALYACTLLKVHPQLDTLLRPASSTPTVPVEICYPRSINSSAKLAAAAKNGGSQTGVAGAPLTMCARNLGIALAQTQVMRKLRGRLTRNDEVEIGWFLRAYASELVSPEAIAKSLASRPQVSPEAQGLASASSDPPRPGTPDSTQLPSNRATSAMDGMATWASRGTFLERCVVHKGGEDNAFEIGDVVVGGGVRAKGKPATRAGDLVFSPRVRILAGWSPKPLPKLPVVVLPPPKKMAAPRAPPPWIRPRRNLRAAPIPPSADANVQAAHDKLTARAGEPATEADLPSPTTALTPAQSIALETRRRLSVTDSFPPTPDSVTTSLPDSDEQAFVSAESGMESEDEVDLDLGGNTTDDDDVPIATLHQIRRRSTIASMSIAETSTLKPPSPPGEAEQREHQQQQPSARPWSPFEQERISRLESELERLRRRDREREQELLRIHAEKRLEENKRQLQAARERRKLGTQNELSAVLQDPRYGAGDAMLAHRASLRSSVSLADVRQQQQQHQQRWPTSGDPPMKMPSPKAARPAPSPSMARVQPSLPTSPSRMSCSSPTPPMDQVMPYQHERASTSHGGPLSPRGVPRRGSALFATPATPTFNGGSGGFHHHYPSAGPYSPQSLHHQSLAMPSSTSMVQLAHGGAPHSQLLASPGDLHQPRRRSNAMLPGNPQPSPAHHFQQYPPQQGQGMMAASWHQHQQLQQLQQTGPYQQSYHAQQPYGQPQPLVMLQRSDVPMSARSSRMGAM